MSKRLSLVLLASALLVASCTSSAAETMITTTTVPTTTTTTTVPTTTTTSTTTTSTTTTTIPPIPVFDTINGLESLTDESLGVVAIKIDNHPNARPHTGLQSADVVYELPVEAGLTRFIAMFEINELEKVGPVRSLRPTDLSIVNPLDVPLQVSGGSNWVLLKARQAGTKLLTDNGNGTYRDNARRAPHNLYADTTEVRERIAELEWGPMTPGNLFVYGEADELTETVSTITIPFSQQPPSVWVWDEDRWLHSYRDKVHTSYGLDGEEAQVWADTLIVIQANRYTARPPKPSDGKAVPAMDLLGTGDALILHDGMLGYATWERENNDDTIHLYNEDGSDVVVEPGMIWVSIVPTSETITWE